jgi:hypothetical protein
MSELKAPTPRCERTLAAKAAGTRLPAQGRLNSAPDNSAYGISQRQNGGGAVQLRQALCQDIALNF